MPYLTSIYKVFPELSVRELTLPVAMKHRKKQRFVCHGKMNAVALGSSETSGTLIKDDEISTVSKNEKDLIVKFVKARRWHEYYKVFYGASRTSKEVKSNLRLKELGLNVPEITEYGIALVPTHFWGYTGFYVMEPAPGLGEAFHHLHELAPESRAKFIDNLVQDLTYLKAHRIIYGDLALRNVFCGPEGELCWIDTGIDEYKSHQRKKFERKWKKSVGSFIRLESAKGKLSSGEIEKLKALI